MPAATYDVSKYEESKLHGRDQSFRNCVITMFLFIILCVIIILVTIPWRNTSLRRNTGPEYDKSNNANTKKQFQERGRTDNQRVSQDFTSTTKFRHPVTSPITFITIRDGRWIPTTTIKKLKPPKSTIRQSIEETSTTSKINSTLSTIKLETVKPSITTQDNIESPSQKIDRVSSTTTPKITESSTTVPNKVQASSQNIWDFILSTTSWNFKSSSTDIEEEVAGFSTVLPTKAGRLIFFDEDIDASQTTSQNTGQFSSTTQKTFVASSETNSNQKQLSSTTEENRNNFRISLTRSSKSWKWISNDNKILTTRTRDSSQKSPSITGSTESSSSSSTSPHNSEASSILSSKLQPDVPLSRIVPLKTRIPEEISSRTSLSDRVSSFSNSDKMPDQLSTNVELVSFSPLNNTTSLLINRSRKSQIREIVESSIGFTTKLLRDFSSASVISTETSDYSKTDSQSTNTFRRAITAGNNDQTTSLDELLRSLHHSNQFSIPIREINKDRLIAFESTTTRTNEKNKNSEFKRISTTATPLAIDSNTSITNAFTSIRNETLPPMRNDTDKVQYEKIRQIPSDENHNLTTTEIYLDEEFKLSTPNIFNQSIDGVVTKNENTIDDECLSGYCKQFASRIMSYMNHSADACDDFYEYACGGMEADPQINNRNLADEAYERIERQLKKSKTNEYSTFKNYYNSCIKYYQDTTQDEKIQQAAEKLINIGHLSVVNVDDPGITQLITYMILHNNPVLFDIVPDIDEDDPQKFILRLGPVINNQSPFHKFEKDACSVEDDENFSNDYYLEKLHEDYESCKNNETRLRESIAQTIKIFDVNQTDKIVTEIQRLLVKVFSNYPRNSQIHENYESKNYSIITIDTLQKQIRFINWIELIQNVTKKSWTSNTKLQIYMKDDLINILKSLDSIDKDKIHNAFYWLYAQNLYEQFIKPRTNEYLKKQCLHIAMNYLPNDATHIYYSSFTEKEIAFMNLTVNKIFMDLKETLRLKFGRIRVTRTYRDRLMKKIANIQISSPKNLYFENMVNINTTDKFFDSTIWLMKRLREDMYEIINNLPSDPHQLWTYFAKPFQPLSRSIYSLNIILIPFGAIDISHMIQNNNEFDYLKFATVGNLIAREIAHFFDENGFRYWNGAHSFTSALKRSEYSIYEDYINCHKNFLFNEPINITLPASKKHIFIKIPPATVNERLSDIIGVRLAHETLARMESTSFKRLPWLKLDIHKLFYLAYAQRYCTKVPLTSSYVSLYENFIMPSRLKIFATAFNNKDLGELWDCPEGSSVLPNFTCEIFPDLTWVTEPRYF